MPTVKAASGLLVTAILASLVTIGRAQTTHTVPAQFSTIQAAINAAANGDQVLVAPGTYNESLDFNGKAILVRSLAGATTTTIDPMGMGTAVTFRSGEPRSARLDGFTVRGGTGGNTIAGIPDHAAPGGILVVASAPTVRNCFIEFNTGGDGIASAGPTAMTGGAGAIACFASSFPLFQHCEIRNNTGGRGGDILIPPGSLAVGKGGNGGAGALVSVAAYVDVADCNIEDNQGGDGGTATSLATGGDGGSGGLDILGGQPGVGNTRVIANLGGNGGLALAGIGAAGAGGVAANDTALFAMLNCVIAQNSAGSGLINASLVGGIRKEGLTGVNPPMQILHCTIADNVAGTSPLATGGVYGLAEIRNSIVWGNGVGAEIGGATTLVAYTNVQDGFIGFGNLNADPLFKDSSQRNYHLLTGTPCRDQANSVFASFIDVDIDNDPRVVNGVADIGADEVCLEGTDEDFVMVSSINGLGDPFRCVKSAVTGDSVLFGWISPAGTFTGENVVLLAQFHDSTSLPIISPILHPAIHLTVNQTALIQSTGMLPPGGDFFMINALPVPSGVTARVQAIVLSSTAANGIFASSRAHDINHQ